MELNDKLLEKAKEAKSAEELVAIAKENSIQLTDEEAKTYFAKLNAKEGELADDELDNVAGGRKCGTIYKDGRPVVTCLNSCEHYLYEFHYEWWREDRGNGDGKCHECTYYKKQGYLFICTCPERYEN